MNTKKFFLAFFAVFAVLEITNYLVHGVILDSTYKDEMYRSVFRPEADMISKMWIGWVTDIIWSYFFVFLFVKGYENKGIGEGLRFGLYIGLFYVLVNSYGMYVVLPLQYSLVLQWFIYGLIQTLILGAITAAIYKPKEAKAAEPAAA